MTSSNPLENALIKLLSSETYHANLLLQMKIQYMPTSKIVPTAGVGVRNGQLMLYVNGEFWNTLSLQSQCDLLCHETAHVFLGHLYERGQKFPKKQHKLANVAFDTAIHEVLHKIKNNTQMNKIVCTVENFKIKYDIDLSPNQTSEYYFNELKKNKDKFPKAKDGEEGIDFGDSIDSHDWDDVDVDEAKAATREAMEKAAQKTKEMGKAGSIPGEAIITLEALNKHKVKWNSIFRRYIGNNISNVKKSNRNRMNRRDDSLLIPGSRKRGAPRIIAIVDTSGSMSQEELTGVVSEFNGMSKLGYEILVIEADAEVACKPRKFDKRAFKTLHGGGGTLYQPAIDTAKKLKPDVIVYFGDMDSADEPVDPNIPFVWLATKRQKPPGNFGKLIYLCD